MISNFRRVLKSRLTYLYGKKTARHVPTPTKMERIESNETSALKAQTPGGYPKNTIRNKERSLVMRYVVENLVEALHCKLEGRGFDSR